MQYINKKKFIEPCDEIIIITQCWGIFAFVKIVKKNIQNHTKAFIFRNMNI